MSTTVSPGGLSLLQKSSGLPAHPLPSDPSARSCPHGVAFSRASRSRNHVGCVAFVHRPLSPSNTHLRLLRVFLRLHTSLLCRGVGDTPRCGNTPVYVPVHPLRGILVTLKFWQLRVFCTGETLQFVLVHARRTQAGAHGRRAFSLIRHRPTASQSSCPASREQGFHSPTSA